MTSEDGTDILPVGTVAFEGVDKITEVNESELGSLTIKRGEFAIDGEAVEIMRSTGGRGEYNVELNDLLLNLSPSTAKVGNYSTKITWTLNAAP